MRIVVKVCNVCLEKSSQPGRTEYAIQTVLKIKLQCNLEVVQSFRKALHRNNRTDQGVWKVITGWDNLDV